jgi:hypothetical protein
MAFTSRILTRYTPKLEARAITPLVVAEAADFACRYAADDYWACAPDSLASVDVPRGASPSVAKNEDDAGECALDESARVAVREMAFPGDKSYPVLNKYIYILRAGDGTPVAEIESRLPEATSSGGDPPMADLEVEWHLCMDPSPDAEPSGRKLTGPRPAIIDLPADVYRFYISPVRLSSRAFKHLVANRASCGIEENLEAQAAITVAVPCPFAWAEEAHHDYFTPALRDYRRFATDKQVQSANAIHNALKAWIDHDGDALDIEDDLDTQEFKVFRKEFDQYEKRLREQMDKAAAYLAGWLDSHAHRTAEMAAQDLGERDAALCLGHWAYVAHDLMQAEPTRRFAEALVQDKARFVCTHVYFGVHSLPDPWGLTEPADEHSKLPSDNWAKWSKRSLTALLGLSTVLSPALYGYLINSGRARDHAQLVELYTTAMIHLKVVKNMPVKDFIALVRSSPVGSTLEAHYGIGTPWTGAFNVFKEQRVGDAAKVFKTRFDALDRQLAEGLTPYVRSAGWVRNLALPLDIILSTAVAYLEISALIHSLEMNQDVSLLQLSGVLKASTDVARSVTSIMAMLNTVWKSGAEAALEQTAKALLAAEDPATGVSLAAVRRRDAIMLAERLAERQSRLAQISGRLVVLGRLSGVLSVVSGLCEMYGRFQKGISEVGRQDWGAAVGHGVAFLGAALSVAGGVIAICTAAGGTFFGIGAVGGLIIGAIGAGLVLIGALLASIWRKNEHEDFARGSCFGNQDDEFDVEWCDTPLFREHTPAVHMRNLMVLLSNFWVTVEGDGRNNTSSKLVIRPGPLVDGDTFLVRLETTAAIYERATSGGAAAQLSATTYGTRSLVSVLHIKPFAKGVSDEWVKVGTLDQFRPGATRVVQAAEDEPMRIEVPLTPEQYYLMANRVMTALPPGSALFDGGAGVTVHVRLLRSAKSGMPGLPINPTRHVKFSATDAAGEQISSANTSYHYTPD